MVRVLESDKYDPFKNTTNTSYYDDLMDDSPLGNARYSTRDYYKFEKGVEAKIVQMTASEYMDMVSSDVFNGDAYKGLDMDKIQEYASLMKHETKFPLPYLNISDNKGQEGRHRMLAAAKAFGEHETFNVLLVQNSNPTEDEMLAYAKAKSPDHPDWVMDMLNAKFNKKSSEPIEPDLESSEMDAIFLDKGTIIDMGDGPCIIQKMDLKGSDSIELDCKILKSGELVAYEVYDDDKITYYSEYDNPELYDKYGGI